MKDGNVKRMKEREGDMDGWMDGWYIYIKGADGTRCCWWMYPRVSLAYHMLEVLVVKMVDDDAGPCLMMRSVGKGGKGGVGEVKEVEGGARK